MIEIDIAALRAQGYDHEAALIDLGFVGELLQDYGVEVMGEVVDSLSEESAVALSQLIETETAAEAARLLHFLRGSALNTGLAAFARRCDALETAAKAGTMPDLDTLADLTACFEASRDNLTILVACFET